MLSFLSSLFIRRPQVQRARMLSDLCNEMDTNLERCCVLEQREFITMGFEQKVWKKIQDMPGLDLPEEVLSCEAFLDEFNALLEDIRVFEKNYMSNAESMTQKNAIVLHDKKEALDEMFPGVRLRIVTAQKTLGQMMDKMPHA